MKHLEWRSPAWFLFCLVQISSLFLLFIGRIVVPGYHWALAELILTLGQSVRLPLHLLSNLTLRPELLENSTQGKADPSNVKLLAVWALRYHVVGGENLD